MKNDSALDVFAAGTLLMLSQAHTLSLIITLAAFAGLAGEFYRPACSALLTDLVPPHLRMTVFAAYRMSFNGGWVLTSLRRLSRHQRLLLAFRGRCCHVCPVRIGGVVRPAKRNHSGEAQ